MAKPYFMLKGVSKATASKNKTKTALIEIRYNCPDGGRYVRSTGETIQVQHWSFVNGCARSSYTEVDKDGKAIDAQRFNDQLKALSAQITDAVREMRAQNTAITKESLTRYLEEQKQENTIKAEEKLTLLQFIDKFIKECEEGIYKEVGKVRVRKYKVAQKLLKEYHKKNPVVYSNINPRFYRTFEAHLRLNCRARSGRMKGEPLTVNYIGSIIAILKTFLTRASTDDRCDFTFPEEIKKQFVADSEDVDAVCPTEAELKVIYDLDLSTTLYGFKRNGMRLYWYAGLAYVMRTVNALIPRRSLKLKEAGS